MKVKAPFRWDLTELRDMAASGPESVLVRYVLPDGSHASATYARRRNEAEAHLIAFMQALRQPTCWGMQSTCLSA